MQSILQDLLFSLRQFRKKPGLAITAIVSLTLGIGATTAVFSVIYSLLVNPYPYKGADRMIHLVLADEAGHDRWAGLTGPQLAVLRQAPCLESVAAEDGTWNLTTTGEDLPDDVPSVKLTGNAGSHFGVPALMGRMLIPSDAPAGQDPAPVIVLSYKFWQRHFNADPAIIGRNLQLVHQNYQIVGVMPPRFTWDDADVYLPLKVTGDTTYSFGTLIKVKPGFTHEAVNQALQPVMEQFAKQNPAHFPQKFRVKVQGLNDRYMRDLGTSLFLLLGAVSLLLLIGCANVSILLLARGTARQYELAVRAAVGASRWRIQRQLLTEAVTLSLLGAFGGIILAYRLLPLLIGWLPEYSYPHEVTIGINLPVLTVSVVISIVTGILFGLSPALQLSRVETAQLMQSSSRRTTGGGRSKRMHGLLVAGQIGLTVLLLTSAGAAVNGFVRVVRADLGYDPHNTMSVGIPIHQNTHGKWADRSTYFERLRERISKLPDVVEAGISTNATPPSNGFDGKFEMFDRPSAQQRQMRINMVDSQYFSVLHIPLAQGRLWDAQEMARAAKLVVINQTAAKQFWPKGDAVGKQLRLPEMRNEPPFALGSEGNTGWLSIIGVVGDARNDGLRDPIKPAVYVPYPMQMSMYTQILVRTRKAPLSVLNSVRGVVKSVDPDQQVFGRVHDLDQWIQEEDAYAYGRLVAALFSSFSILALALAAVGLFSVVSYSVSQRTNEFGIRMALGARPHEVLSLVFASTARSVLGGLVVGVALSLVAGGFLAKWAKGSEQNAFFFAAAILLLMGAAALAAFIPARRASAIDPMIALRCD